MPDILLTPTNPISSSFYVEGLTCEGRKFVKFHFPDSMVTDRFEMVSLEFMAKLGNLTVETDWACAGKAMAL